MNKVWIGIDNGVTGTVGTIRSETGFVDFFKTPVKNELSYTKQKQFINRIDCKVLKDLLYYDGDLSNVFVFIERPMVNPMRFKATVSALRALEATLIVVEDLGYPYQYIDSKEWQKEMLPGGLKGTPELKKASLDVGKRLFPQIGFAGFKDADGLLIAEYARRKGL